MIEKKVWPKYFQEILDGNKTFELRLANFDCKKGDTLYLREWDPEKEEYTGRELKKEVGYIARIKDMKFWKKEDIERYGFQVISLK